MRLDHTPDPDRQITCQLAQPLSFTQLRPCSMDCVAVSMKAMPLRQVRPPVSVSGKIFLDMTSGKNVFLVSSQRVIYDSRPWGRRQLAEGGASSISKSARCTRHQLLPDMTPSDLNTDLIFVQEMLDARSGAGLCRNASARDATSQMPDLKILAAVQRHSRRMPAQGPVS